MQKRRLGNSDMDLSPIGFGAWAIGGGDWAFSWGPQDDNHSIAAIHKALELGVNWIDTAAVYGLGHSEEVVARAVKTASKKPYLFTKSSMIWDDKKEITNSQKQIRRECEASSAVCKSKLSTSTRSTGPSPTKTSKRAGPSWQTCNAKEKFAGSASPTSASRRWSAS